MFQKLFHIGSLFLLSLVSTTPLSCISMNNQACKVRPKIINVKIAMSPYFILLLWKQVNVVVALNNINDPYSKICVPDVVKDLKVKVFNLMLRTNETRHIKCNETCKCKFRLDASVYNNKQHWNDDKCQCKCKELIDKGVGDKGYAWYLSNCECDKSYDVGEYLDYENCKCRKRLVDKLVEECTKNIDEAQLAEIALFKHGNECVCCYTVFIVLAVIVLTVNIGIGA